MTQDVLTEVQTQATTFVECVRGLAYDREAWHACARGMEPDVSLSGP